MVSITSIRLMSFTFSTDTAMININDMGTDNKNGCGWYKNKNESFLYNLVKDKEHKACAK